MDLLRGIVNGRTVMLQNWRNMIRIAEVKYVTMLDSALTIASTVASQLGHLTCIDSASSSIYTSTSLMYAEYLNLIVISLSSLL